MVSNSRYPNNGSSKINLKENKMKAREFFIAGVKFHDLKKVINDLRVGDEFDLVPEPENKFSRTGTAVRIEFDGVHCGYVPDVISSEITAAFRLSKEDDEGIICVITFVDPKAKSYECCKVRVYDPADEIKESEDDYEDYEDNHS
jgi:hypothetical protein